ncbi:hypothetical protein PAL_GLEAN10006576 [Pteropus alecto]|uniref:Uncharacterized protein n=1 Tax=Pteropus alecto TaxID=9402 RepID=L5L3D3_PTEAL|nr:hypothetical protein PAL_GLEAN10006576 [Pteropus alecto]
MYSSRSLNPQFLVRNPCQIDRTDLQLLKKEKTSIKQDNVHKTLGVMLSTDPRLLPQRNATPSPPSGSRLWRRDRVLRWPLEARGFKLWEIGRGEREGRRLGSPKRKGPLIGSPSSRFVALGVAAVRRSGPAPRSSSRLQVLVLALDSDCT